MSACKDGLGQPVAPGTRLLGMTNNGPRFYTVDSVTLYRNGAHTVRAIDEKSRAHLTIKKLTRYLAFDEVQEPADPDQAKNQDPAQAKAPATKRITHTVAEALAGIGSR